MRKVGKLHQRPAPARGWEGWLKGHSEKVVARTVGTNFLGRGSAVTPTREARKTCTIRYFPVCAGRHDRLSGSELARQNYAGDRAIKRVSFGSPSATVRGRPKLAANTSGGFEATHALRSWE
jgi:hypothetical protein